MKKKLGIILVIIFVMAFFAILVFLGGWKATLISFGATFFIVGAIALCLWLLTSD